MCDLAGLLESGRGGDCDVEGARIWLERASKAGHSDATMLLAKMSMLGASGDGSLDEAILIGEEAVKGSTKDQRGQGGQGGKSNLITLAEMYLKRVRKGIQQQSVAALKARLDELGIAILPGVVEKKELVQLLFECTRPPTKDELRAISLLREAAADGDMDATAMLGHLLSTAEGYAQEAFTHMKTAAKHGDADSM